MPKNVFAAAAVLALLCACSHTRTITTKDGSVSVDKGKDGESAVHISGKDGASVDFNSGKPITDYPSDAPLYQGKSVMDMKSSEKHSRVVGVQTSDAAEKVSSFYKTELASKGWTVETTMNSNKMIMYSAKKDGRQLVIGISSDDSGQQTISQTLSDK